jgi:hypothetical protein
MFALNHWYVAGFPWELGAKPLARTLLSHLGYVHLKTIGGNASVHMNAELKV